MRTIGKTTSKPLPKWKQTVRFNGTVGTHLDLGLILISVTQHADGFYRIKVFGHSNSWKIPKKFKTMGRAQLRAYTLVKEHLQSVLLKQLEDSHEDFIPF